MSKKGLVIIIVVGLVALLAIILLPKNKVEPQMAGTDSGLLAVEGLSKPVSAGDFASDGVFVFAISDQADETVDMSLVPATSITIESDCTDCKLSGSTDGTSYEQLMTIDGPSVNFASDSYSYYKIESAGPITGTIIANEES